MAIFPLIPLALPLLWTHNLPSHLCPSSFAKRFLASSMYIITMFWSSLPFVLGFQPLPKNIYIQPWNQNLSVMFHMDYLLLNHLLQFTFLIMHMLVFYSYHANTCYYFYFRWNDLNEFITVHICYHAYTCFCIFIMRILVFFSILD